MDTPSSPHEGSGVAMAPRKRRRAKIACEPCRERKRKCNARLPCETCLQYEYDCYYDVPKKGKKAKFAPSSNSNIPVHTSPLSDGGTAESTTANIDNRPLHNTAHRYEEKQSEFSPANNSNINTKTNSHLESLEANSGAAFVRRLGLKIDPFHAPRLHLFAWNTGDRLAGCPPGTARSVTSMLTKAEMRNLASVYFQNIADAYGFIDRESFFQRLEDRWENPTASKNNTYDPVLCGVAAFGFHFGQKFPAIVEPDLVETARTLLEQHSRSTPCSMDTVTGWVVLVAYLRMSSLPHTTWLASCSMMHVAEAANLHLESPSNTIFERPSEEIDVDIRRRLWGMAQHLHIWASFDLGRTKITIPGASTKPVTPKPGDITSELLALIPLTDQLDPNKTRSVEDLEADMTRVLAEEREDPRVVVAQVNLMLCIFRRLRAQNSNVLNLRMDHILALVMKGVRAVQQLINATSPWQHVANIPFQVICLLLAIDTRASLSLLGDAMCTLQRAASTWDTPVMREAYNTAYLLIFLHQRRKEEDARALRDVLGTHSAAPAMTTESASTSAYAISNNTYGSHKNNNNDGFQSQQQQPTSTAMTATMPTDSAEFLWLEDLISDMPSLREFDLEQFLVQEASELPDLGTMGGNAFGESLLG